MILMFECYALQEGQIIKSDQTGNRLEIKHTGILIYTETSGKLKGITGQWLEGPDKGLGTKIPYIQLRFFSRVEEGEE